ncbi:MAG: hypothetical protein Q8O03_06485 [Nanoarchaeota archaeon]|nr:hypothetical protein [Nanoarchaeota archaeon]
MKIPKTFIPEKSLEKNLEQILSKKFYMLNKERNKVMVYSLNGELLGSTMIGRCMDSLEMFTFHNKKMLTVKFGDSNTQDNNRAIFDERLNHLILTASYPNQAYCVFERKNGRDLLMLNTAAQRTKGTKITYYEPDGTKLDDFYYELHDVLTNKAFVIRTNEQNYLALCFNYYTILVHEDLKKMLTMHTIRDVNDIHSVNLKGEERVIALCFNEHLSYQVLRIFDNRLNLMEQLNTKDFKPVLPVDDPWHDKLLSFEPYRIGSKDYFFAAVERKKEKDRIDLKVLNTDFEEVFQLEDIVHWRTLVEKFNGKDHFFVMFHKGSVVNVYDENFNLKDEILVHKSSLQGRYKILEFNCTSYFACVNEGYLTFHSGKIPFYGSHWTNKKVASADIRLKNINSGLKKIIPFDYKGKDFIALEYDNNDGIDVYDDNFKFVRNFPGGDFCIA